MKRNANTNAAKSSRPNSSHSFDGGPSSHLGARLCSMPEKSFWRRLRRNILRENGLRRKLALLRYALYATYSGHWAMNEPKRHVRINIFKIFLTLEWGVVVRAGRGCGGRNSFSLWILRWQKSRASALAQR